MARIVRCSDCAQPLDSSLPGEPRPWFRVDGTAALICRPCVREVIQLTGVTASLRRVHGSAHGWDLPPADCPVCQAERADLVQRLAR